MVVAGGVAVVVDHEKDVAFHALLRKGVLVVRTVDVQVVIDGHLHRVFSVHESEETNTHNLLCIFREGEIHKRYQNDRPEIENVTSLNSFKVDSFINSKEKLLEAPVTHGADILHVACDRMGLVGGGNLGAKGPN